MAVQTVNTIDRTGTVNPTTLGAACSSGGDSYPNTGQQVVFWNNTSAGAIVITEIIQSMVDGQPVTSKTFSIAASATIMTGPYPTTSYNDANNRMNFSYSVNPPTGLKMTVLQPTNQ